MQVYVLNAHKDAHLVLIIVIAKYAYKHILFKEVYVIYVKIILMDAVFVMTHQHAQSVY